MLRNIMIREITSKLVLLLLIMTATTRAWAETSDSENNAVQTDSVLTEAEPDTLLSARSAKGIEIYSSQSFTSITISEINGTDENFYYTGTRQQWNEGSTNTRINRPDITDVLVVQTANALKVNFRTSSRNLQTYVFNFRDPENRQFSSQIGTKRTLSVNISRGSNTSWDLISGGLGIGWMSPVNETPDMNTSMWKSNEITWLMALGVRMKHKRNELTFGLGLNWQNFVTKGDHYFHKGDGKLTMLPYGEGTSRHRSRLKIFSLQVPVLYGFSFGKSQCMKFQLGPVLNFNTYSSIETKYKLDGREYTVKTTNVYPRPVTVDGIATISYEGLGVYFRYSPMNKIKTGRGFDFSSISTGLMIGF